MEKLLAEWPGSGQVGGVMFEQMKLVSTAIVILATLLVLVTALPFVPTNDWWIRIWDFPRIQVAALLGLVLLAFPLIHDRRKLRT